MVSRSGGVGKLAPPFWVKDNAMKKLIFVLLAIVLVGCINTRHERPCHYLVSYDDKVDTIFTDHIQIIGGGFMDPSDTYYFYLGEEQVARITGASVMLKKLD